MSIFEALKKLITKRGGTAKGHNIAELISNYAENGSSSGGTLQIIGTTEGTLVTMDKTWTEIYEALEAGRVVTFTHGNTENAFRIFVISAADFNGITYSVYVPTGQVTEAYTTNQADGYPNYSYD